MSFPVVSRGHFPQSSDVVGETECLCSISLEMEMISKEAVNLSIEATIL